MLSVPLQTGRPDELRAPGGLLNGQGAEATIGRKIATGQALTASWRGSATGREKSGTGTGRGVSGVTGRGGGHAAPTGIKSGGSAEEVAAAAARVSVATKTETAARSAADGRSGITTKIEALTERGPERRRAGERLTTEGTKTTGRGTERRGRPRGQAGVEAGKGGTRAGETRRAGRAETASGRGTGSSAPTSAAAAKSGATISGSRATTTASIVNAGEARAPTKRRLPNYLESSACGFFTCHPNEGPVSCEPSSTRGGSPCCLPTLYCFIFYFSTSLFRTSLALT